MDNFGDDYNADKSWPTAIVTSNKCYGCCGWGGLPVYEAFYINNGELRKANESQLIVKNVPVDGFWSISVYNKDGYFQKNKFDSYSINNLTAKPNKDGSVTVNFGTNTDGNDNFLYVMDGWNYIVRLYQPREEILNGQWTFPKPSRLNK